METHSSIIAEKIPWTEGPGRLHFTSHKESDITERLSTRTHTHTHTHTHNLDSSLIHAAFLMMYSEYKLNK